MTMFGKKAIRKPLNNSEQKEVILYNHFPRTRVAVCYRSPSNGLQAGSPELVGLSGNYITGLLKVEEVFGAVH